MLNKKALAGTPSTPAVFVEDVFSTYLYTGNGSTQTITNGIDLAGKGGAVWIKSRSNATSNVIFDTVRGIYKFVATDTTNSQDTINDTLTAFNSTGFTLGSDALDGKVNTSPRTYASWTFRKQAKFFDVVTYTGNGANRTIAHNLGSVPGSIWVKRTDTTGDWQVYHRSNTAAPETDYLVLNSTAATADSDTRWNDTLPTSTVFSLGTDSTVNANGGTYVAYIFAHDAGGFGTAGTDNVISCGSFTTDGSGNATVSLGYEPQFLITKVTNAEGYSWRLLDTMRGWSQSSNDSFLTPNSSAAESNDAFGTPTATGFQYGPSGANTTHIYIAIRRGPMKTPTSGTSVFSPVARAGTGATATVTSGFPVSSAWISARENTVSQGFQIYDRLRGANARLSPPYTQQEYSTPTNELTSFASNTSVTLGASTADRLTNYSGENYINYFFQRAPGFFDVVCDTGTGSTHTISHNLAVAPELIIRKRRDSSTSGTWQVWSSKYSYLSGTAPSDNCTAVLNGSGAFDGYSESSCISTLPTSSVFSVGTQGHWNTASATYVTYLFATLAGVSKVGSYTGTGTTQTINCGFTAGARFVMIKRTDSTGDWYVWDTARGIVSGNDPYLLLNDTAAEVTNTDYIDPVNSGFEISSTAPAAINANGGSFIFMAIA